MIIAERWFVCLRCIKVFPLIVFSSDYFLRISKYIVPYMYIDLFVYQLGASFQKGGKCGPMLRSTQEATASRI